MRTKPALISGAMILVLLWVMAQPVPVIRKLRDLQDVKPSVPPANGDVLVYNSALLLWTNGTAGTTVSLNGTNVTNPNFTDTATVTWGRNGSTVTATAVSSGSGLADRKSTRL